MIQWCQMDELKIDIIKIHLGDQSDAKVLLGTYVCTDTPGEFKWQAGALTKAVQDGKWILIEDIDLASVDVISVILPLLETRKLFIPGRGETIIASNNFQIIATETLIGGEEGTQISRARTIAKLLGKFWTKIVLHPLPDDEIKYILEQLFPELSSILHKFIETFQLLKLTIKQQIYGTGCRALSLRDLIKWCRRVNRFQVGKAKLLTAESVEIKETIFAEAYDCFCGMLSKVNHRIEIMKKIALCWNIPQESIDYFFNKYKPNFQLTKTTLSIGKQELHRMKSSESSESSKNKMKFAHTLYSLRYLERISSCIKLSEPVLLVGETGTGKTSIVQYIANQLGKKLIVQNLSQQSDSTDLLGGFKPIELRSLCIPLKNEFDYLFPKTFSKKANQAYLDEVNISFANQQWDKFIKLLFNITKKVENLYKEIINASTDPAPSSTAVSKTIIKPNLRSRWNLFNLSIKKFIEQRKKISNNFAFSFIEGALVKAVRNGDWVLLDEINLASTETLESLSGLLEGGGLYLTERGDITAIERHEQFRIFACMNPPTDIGKKELPPGLRNRFTEFYIDELTNENDLQTVVLSYLSSITTRPPIEPIVQFYLAAKKEAQTNLSDGANQKPHYSLRSLCRSLQYTIDVVEQFGLHRSLYEGICMSFLTQLNSKSYPIMERLIDKYIITNISKTANKQSFKSLSKQPANNTHIQFTHYWIEKGQFPSIKNENYILTPTIEFQLSCLSRIILTRKYPVLLQGPTSSGKTSVIKYLAECTGHKFVRINNHEHTDIQEYLGCYVSDQYGNLIFQEGILVESVRNGYWVVLDELNLAPSEVLEALNRLLDDNRELYIPETQEVIKPHPHFALFATQNPPGLYGGRKVLSRAFRNRFLELHFDDIPDNELQTILEKTCKIPPSYCKKLVLVMKDLQRQRRGSQVFAGKSSLITLRDLFRWANRKASNYQELAIDGYMILAERLRKNDEKLIIQQIIEQHMKVTLNLNELYSISDTLIKEFNENLLNDSEGEKNKEFKGIVWTKSMKRMIGLLYHSIKNREPVLLIGETGCGKTTVCQLYSILLKRELQIINCHQHTETADFIGSLRPVRGKDNLIEVLRNKIIHFFLQILNYPSSIDRTSILTEILKKQNININENQQNEENLFKQHSSNKLIQYFEMYIKEIEYNKLEKDRMMEEGDSDKENILLLLDTLEKEIKEGVSKYKSLFEWQDGPLIISMKRGDLFLIDEISLAEDSVLERLNSVLEPERTMVLAEKGGGNSIEQFSAHENFLVFATMNPGGDFGKKELSPALRNRFTEIWIGSINDYDEIYEIIHARLSAALSEPFSRLIIDFIKWFNEQLRNKRLISLRDILSWVTFMNSMYLKKQSSPLPSSEDRHHVNPIGKYFEYEIYIHGACLILLDGLAISTGLSERRCNEIRFNSFNKLLSQLNGDNVNLLEISLNDPSSSADIVINENFSFFKHNLPKSFLMNEEGEKAGEDEEKKQIFGINPFFIKQGTEGIPENIHFSLNAPTTSENLIRILRAMQINKPILLEGSPGVGKTSLITALAAASGNKIIRINLSEQTDMMDLLGSDLPIEGGKAGEFGWCDGVFLHAIKNGYWVLLDELNLASQSVLEGLNSCLDHRSVIYIPEIGKEFKCPPSFRVFACQNPTQQGGGRKGLPKSFLNRFTQVYVEKFKEDDLFYITSHQFPQIHEGILKKMIEFNRRIYNDSMIYSKFARKGSPWEFNLRDIFRWCELILFYIKNLSTLDENTLFMEASKFIDLIYLQRMRTNEDREYISSIYSELFNQSLDVLLNTTYSTTTSTGGSTSSGNHYQAPINYKITSDYLNIGNTIVPISSNSFNKHLKYNYPELQILPNQLNQLENIIKCIELNWMVILIGNSASGKTSLIQVLSNLLGKPLHQFYMNSSVDTTELLGGFEQIDLARKKKFIFSKLHQLLSFIIENIIIHTPLPSPSPTTTSTSTTTTSIASSTSSNRNQSIGSKNNKHSSSSSSTYSNSIYFYMQDLENQWNNIKYKCKSSMDLNKHFDQEELNLIQLFIGNIKKHFKQISFNHEKEGKEKEFQVKMEEIENKMKEIAMIEENSITGCFEWIDGAIIEAIEEGNWILIDNVNFCNPSVLDRLNPLLESNGTLMVNERGTIQGHVKILTPHPNFRIFLTMDPDNGEISRAMRNRGIEINLLSSAFSHHHHHHHHSSSRPKDGSLAPDVEEEIKQNINLIRILNKKGIPSSKISSKLIEFHEKVKSVISISTHGSEVKLGIREVVRWSELLITLLNSGFSLFHSLLFSMKQVYIHSQRNTKLKNLILNYFNEYITTFLIEIKEEAADGARGTINDKYHVVPYYYTFNSATLWPSIEYSIQPAHYLNYYFQYNKNHWIIHYFNELISNQLLENIRNFIQAENKNQQFKILSDEKDKETIKKQNQMKYKSIKNKIREYLSKLDIPKYNWPIILLEIYYGNYDDYLFSPEHNDFSENFTSNMKELLKINENHTGRAEWIGYNSESIELRIKQEEINQRNHLPMNEFIDFIGRILFMNIVENMNVSSIEYSLDWLIHSLEPLEKYLSSINPYFTFHYSKLFREILHTSIFNGLYQLNSFIETYLYSNQYLQHNASEFVVNIKENQGLFNKLKLIKENDKKLKEILNNVTLYNEYFEQFIKFTLRKHYESNLLENTMKNQITILQQSYLYFNNNYRGDLENKFVKLLYPFIHDMNAFIQLYFFHLPNSLYKQSPSFTRTASTHSEDQASLQQYVILHEWMNNQSFLSIFQEVKMLNYYLELLWDCFYTFEISVEIFITNWEYIQSHWNAFKQVFLPEITGNNKQVKYNDTHTNKLKVGMENINKKIEEINAECRSMKIYNKTNDLVKYGINTYLLKNESIIQTYNKIIHKMEECEKYLNKLPFSVQLNWKSEKNYKEKMNVIIDGLNTLQWIDFQWNQHHSAPSNPSFTTLNTLFHSLLPLPDIIDDEISKIKLKFSEIENKNVMMEENEEKNAKEIRIEQIKDEINWIGYSTNTIIPLYDHHSVLHESAQISNLSRSLFYSLQFNRIRHSLPQLDNQQQANEYLSQFNSINEEYEKEMNSKENKGKVKGEIEKLVNEIVCNTSRPPMDVAPYKHLLWSFHNTSLPTLHHHDGESGNNGGELFQSKLYELYDEIYFQYSKRIWNNLYSKSITYIYSLDNSLSKEKKGSSSSSGSSDNQSSVYKINNHTGGGDDYLELSTIIENSNYKKYIGSNQLYQSLQSMTAFYLISSIESLPLQHRDEKVTQLNKLNEYFKSIHLINPVQHEWKFLFHSFFYVIHCHFMNEHIQKSNPSILIDLHTFWKYFNDLFNFIYSIHTTNTPLNGSSFTNDTIKSTFDGFYEKIKAYSNYDVNWSKYFENKVQQEEEGEGKKENNYIWNIINICKKWVIFKMNGMKMNKYKKNEIRSRVWVMIGLIKFELLVPETGIDPSSKYKVKLNALKNKYSKNKVEIKMRRKIDENKFGKFEKNSNKHANTTRSNEKEIIQKIKEEQGVLKSKINKIKNKIVNRVSNIEFHELYEELEKVRNHLISRSKLEEIQGYLEHVDHSSAEREYMWQERTNELISKLIAKYQLSYPDIIYPIINSIYLIKYGLRLQSSMISRYLLSLSSPIASTFLSISNNSNHKLNLLQYYQTLNKYENIIIHLLKIPFLSPVRLSSTTTALLPGRDISDGRNTQQAGKEILEINDNRKKKGMEEIDFMKRIEYLLSDETITIIEAFIGKGAENEMNECFSKYIKTLLVISYIYIFITKDMNERYFIIINKIFTIYTNTYLKQREIQREKQLKEQELFKYKEQTHKEGISEEEEDEKHIKELFPDYSKEFNDVLDEDELELQRNEEEKLNPKGNQRRVGEGSGKEEEQNEKIMKINPILNEKECKFLFEIYERIFLLKYEEMSMNKGLLLDKHKSMKNKWEEMNKKKEKKELREMNELTMKEFILSYDCGNLLFQKIMNQIPSSKIDKEIISSHIISSYLHYNLLLSSPIAPVSSDPQQQRTYSINQIIENKGLDGIGLGFSEWNDEEEGGGGRSSKIYNIHTDSNIIESQLLLTPLNAFKSTINEILELYPEHPVLQSTIKIITKILAFPVNTPLMKFITGLELLLKKAHEWEVNASSKLSLKEDMNEIAALIARWRKLELKTWPYFLATRAIKFETKACLWWFDLYQTIILSMDSMILQLNQNNQYSLLQLNQLIAHKHTPPPVSSSKSKLSKKGKGGRAGKGKGGDAVEKDSEEDKIAAMLKEHEEKEKKDEKVMNEYFEKLIQTITDFAQSSNIGEYPIRMKLLFLFSIQIKEKIKLLKKHKKEEERGENNKEKEKVKEIIAKLKNEDKNYKKLIEKIEKKGKEELKFLKGINNVIRNIYLYYMQYWNEYIKFIEMNKSPIEKNLNNFVKLSKWEKLEYYRLKDVADRSHRKLTKFSRDFEKILLTPLIKILPNNDENYSYPPSLKQLLPNLNYHLINLPTNNLSNLSSLNKNKSKKSIRHKKNKRKLKKKNELKKVKENQQNQGKEKEGAGSGGEGALTTYDAIGKYKNQHFEKQNQMLQGKLKEMITKSKLKIQLDDYEFMKLNKYFKRIKKIILNKLFNIEKEEKMIDNLLIFESVSINIIERANELRTNNKPITEKQLAFNHLLHLLKEMNISHHQKDIHPDQREIMKLLQLPTIIIYHDEIHNIHQLNNKSGSASMNENQENRILSRLNTNANEYSTGKHVSDTDNDFNYLNIFNFTIQHHSAQREDQNIFGFHLKNDFIKSDKYYYKNIGRLQKIRELLANPPNRDIPLQKLHILTSNIEHLFSLSLHQRHFIIQHFPSISTLFSLSNHLYFDFHFPSFLSTAPKPSSTLPTSSRSPLPSQSFALYLLEKQVKIVDNLIYYITQIRLIVESTSNTSLNATIEKHQEDIIHIKSLSSPFIQYLPSNRSELSNKVIPNTIYYQLIHQFNRLLSIVERMISNLSTSNGEGNEETENYLATSLDSLQIFKNEIEASLKEIENHDNDKSNASSQSKFSRKIENHLLEFFNELDFVIKHVLISTQNVQPYIQFIQSNYQNQFEGDGEGEDDVNQSEQQNEKEKEGENKEKEGKGEGSEEEEEEADYINIPNMQEKILKSMEILDIKTLNHRISHLIDIIKAISDEIKVEDENGNKVSKNNILEIIEGYVYEYSGLLNEYTQIIKQLLYYFMIWYKGSMKCIYILSGLLTTLFMNGFCKVEEGESKESDEVDDNQQGTGLGTGEGKKDVSNEIDDEEQLQKPEKDENEQPKPEEQDNAIESAQDFQSELYDMKEDKQEKDKESSSDEEEEDDEMDKDMGDVDRDKEDVIDEKLWDESDEEDKNQNEDEMDEGEGDNLESNQVHDELLANENGKENNDKEGEDRSDDEENDDDQQNDENSEDEKKEEDGEDGEEEETDMGEFVDIQDDKERNKFDEMNEKEEEDLPENMDIGSEEEENGGEDDKNQEEQGEGDEEMNLDENDEENGENEENKEGEEEEGKEEEKEEEDENEKNEENKIPTNEDAEEEQKEEEMNEEILNKNKAENQYEEEVKEKQYGVKDQTGDESNIDSKEDENDMNNEKEEENKMEETEDDENKTNQSENQKQYSEMNQHRNKKEDENEEETEGNQFDPNPYRSIGDATKQWENKIKLIKEKEQKPTKPQEKEKEKQNKNEKEDEYTFTNKDEEAENEDEDFEQTLGSATDEQRKESKPIIDENEQKEEEGNEENKKDDDVVLEKDKKDEEMLESNDQLLPPTVYESEIDKNKLKEDRKNAEMMEETEEVNEELINKSQEELEELEELIDSHNNKEKNYTEEEEEKYIEETRKVLTAQEIFELRQQLEEELTKWRENPTEIQRSQQLWMHYEELTQVPSQELCEQLRLILEPTLATKLKGDYRSGKRINMKKVIPYIASQFRKDKIWLRRTKPNQRHYQILIAIDDSASMSVNHAGPLACEAMTMIAKALSQLEVGELAIVKFGEAFQLVHPFDQPFSDHVGPQILSQFLFNQKSTNMLQLLHNTISLLEQARSQSHSQTEHVQLVFVISDGRLSKKSDIGQWTREAEKKRMLIVFIVIDNPKSQNSILSLEDVSFVKGKVQKSLYIDDFPFPYYVILRDLTNLPDVLADTLRQWFELTMNT